MSSVLFLTFLILITASSAYATPDEDDFKTNGPIPEDAVPAWAESVPDGPPTIGPVAPTVTQKQKSATVFANTQNVLQGLHAPEEPSYQSLMQNFNGHQTKQGLQTLLKYIDSRQAFVRFLDIENVAGEDNVTIFQDSDSKSVVDYKVRLAPNIETRAQDLTLKLKKLKARQNPSLPLQGLKIAIDPGHMGGPVWDERTGKWVTDHRGHKLSEGVLTLIMSLLLEKDLQNLGATVLVTRHELAPVTKLKWQDLDIQKYGLLKLLDSTLEKWFLNLMGSGLQGNSLLSAVQASRDFRSLFAEVKRWEYYILDEDLAARSNMINAFQPDLAFFFHFDTSNPQRDPHGLNAGPRRDRIKSYVAGTFAFDELAMRRTRMNVGRHLLNPESYLQSVRLSRSLVHHISQQMQLPLESTTDDTTTSIEPGIMGRNLHLTREVAAGAMTFVECLYYNDPYEFQSLSSADYQMQVADEKLAYSKRLVFLEQSIRQGILDYVTGTPVETGITSPSVDELPAPPLQTSNKQFRKKKPATVRTQRSQRHRHQ